MNTTSNDAFDSAMTELFKEYSTDDTLRRDRDADAPAWFLGLTQDDDRTIHFNDAVIPQWLILATEGTELCDGGEAGDDQLCRVWGYLDWLALIARFPTAIGLAGTGVAASTGPAIGGLTLANELMREGLTVDLDVAVWWWPDSADNNEPAVSGPPFQIELWGMGITAPPGHTLDADRVDKISEQLAALAHDDALAGQASGNRGVTITSYDVTDTEAHWNFA